MLIYDPPLCILAIAMIQANGRLLRFLCSTPWGIANPIFVPSIVVATGQPLDEDFIPLNFLLTFLNFRQPRLESILETCSDD